jgi:hypothetical protein
MDTGISGQLVFSTCPFPQQTHSIFFSEQVSELALSIPLFLWNNFFL